MTERFKKIQIEGYGEVVIKKFNYLEQCNLKGKLVSISVDPRTGREETNVNSSALFFWTVVYGIKSLPKHPQYWTLPEEKKVQIVSELGSDEDEPEDLGNLLYREVMSINNVDMKAVGKKNSPSDEGEKQQSGDNH